MTAAQDNKRNKVITNNRPLHRRRRIFRYRFIHQKGMLVPLIDSLKLYGLHPSPSSFHAAALSTVSFKLIAFLLVHPISLSRIALYN